MIAQSKRRFRACNAAFPLRAQSWSSDWSLNRNTHERLPSSLRSTPASGHKELAIQEAQHAVDLMPVSKDIYDGALVLEGLAQVYTWTGEH